jgi:hypothetical protein
MFETTIAGSLPKPAWLAEPNKLWAPWRLEGAELDQAKGDATLLAIKEQEDAGIDIVGDGEQARQHFVHGFLERVEGIDFAHKVEMGIRADRYKAMVPQVVGPVRLKGRVHAFEARLARAHTKRKLKFTLPGPMTIADTIADRHYGDKVKMALAFADLLNEEARGLEKDGVDVIQFDEPAFNVFLGEVTDWGVPALERAAKGLEAPPPCTSATATASGQCRLEGDPGASGVSTRGFSRHWPGAGSTRCLWCAALEGAAGSLGLLAGRTSWSAPRCGERGDGDARGRGLGRRRGHQACAEGAHPAVH